MCGRFTLTSTPEALAERFGLDAAPEVAPRYNIAPGEDVLAVRGAADASAASAPRAGRLRWGLVPRWADDPSVGARMINARAETLESRPAYRDAFASRRCLVPADGFYEWRDQGGFRQPYYVRPAGGGPMGIAGLWDRWQRGGEVLETCTLVTTAAPDVLRPVHDRAPLLLRPGDFGAWLAPDTTTDVLRRLVAPDAVDAPVLVLHPVSPRVNRADRDDPECIAPVPEPPRQEALFR